MSTTKESAGEEEFISFDIVPSFSPSDITRGTFSRLLSCYPTTVREVYKDKLVIKFRPKRPKRGSKDVAPPTPLAPETHIQKEIETFLKLDEWRYSQLPARVKDRSKAESSVHDEEATQRKPAKGTYLDKDELMKLMDWKVKHGVFRPTLLGLVKSNQAPLIRKTTTAAFAALPTADPSTDPDAAFPQASLDALTGPLRGVGPATASLILCTGTCDSESQNQMPFFSDELYLWLCLDDYPSAEGTENKDDEDDEEQEKKSYKRKNGELTIKYNLREYRLLWNAVLELRERLNKAVNPDSTDEDEKRIFSVTDIEKVAFVLGNIDLSGYFGEPTQPRPSLHDVPAPKKPHPSKAEKQKAAEAQKEKAQAKAGEKKRKREEKYAKKVVKKKKSTGKPKA